MRKAIFLDKDGSIIRNVPYNVNPESMTLLNNAGEGLRLLKRAGFKLVVVTDQSGVARGYFKEEDMGPVHDRLQELLKAYQAALDGFYYCPHHPQGSVPPYNIDCECRKPKPGMILRATQDLHIDLSRSWMVGDILNDVEAGNRAGVRTVIIDNGGETKWRWDAVSKKPDLWAKDLLEAAGRILSFDGNKETTYGKQPGRNHRTV